MMTAVMMNNTPGKKKTRKKKNQTVTLQQCPQKKAKTTVEPVHNSHPWDHAKWLLYRGGLFIEVSGALELHSIYLVDGVWDLSYWLAYRGDLPNQVAVSTGSTV